VISTDLKKAIDFVQKKGNEKEVERLKCILEGKKAEPRFIAEFCQLQNSDGGFPLDMEKGKPSTLTESGFVLRQLEDLNLLQTDVAKKTIKFFIEKQNKDGSWNESEDIVAYDIPPWINPRDIRVKVLLTAYVGFWLAKYGYSKDGRVRKACFLTNYRNENGAFKGFRHTTWIGASLFAIVHGKESKITKEALEYLTKIPKDQWTPSQIGWLLWCLSAANFTKNNKFVKHFLRLLAEGQNSDGSFPSEDGAEFHINATLEAIKILKHFSST